VFTRLLYQIRGREIDIINELKTKQSVKLKRIRDREFVLIDRIKTKAKQKEDYTNFATAELV
jgi:hypothetical protein